MICTRVCTRERIPQSCSAATCINDPRHKAQLRSGELHACITSNGSSSGIPFSLQRTGTRPEFQFWTVHWKRLEPHWNYTGMRAGSHSRHQHAADLTQQHHPSRSMLRTHAIHLARQPARQHKHFQPVRGTLALYWHMQQHLVSTEHMAAHQLHLIHMRVAPHPAERVTQHVLQAPAAAPCSAP